MSRGNFRVNFARFKKTSRRTKYDIIFKNSTKSLCNRIGEMGIDDYEKFPEVLEERLEQIRAISSKFFKKLMKEGFEEIEKNEREKKELSEKREVEKSWEDEKNGVQKEENGEKEKNDKMSITDDVVNDTSLKIENKENLGEKNNVGESDQEKEKELKKQKQILELEKKKRKRIQEIKQTIKEMKFQKTKFFQKLKKELSSPKPKSPEPVPQHHMQPPLTFPLPPNPSIVPVLVSTPGSPTTTVMHCTPVSPMATFSNEIFIRQQHQARQFEEQQRRMSGSIPDVPIQMTSHTLNRGIVINSMEIRRRKEERERNDMLEKKKKQMENDQIFHQKMMKTGQGGGNMIQNRNIQPQQRMRINRPISHSMGPVMMRNNHHGPMPINRPTLNHSRINHQRPTVGRRTPQYIMQKDRNDLRPRLPRNIQQGPNNQGRINLQRPPMNVGPPRMQSRGPPPMQIQRQNQQHNRGLGMHRGRMTGNFKFS